MTTLAELDTLIANITEYRDKDITHDELGSVGGFHEAQELKLEVSEYFLKILRDLREVFEKADPVLVCHVWERINGEGRSLGSIETEIERLVKEEFNTPQFPNRRASQISSLKERIQNVKLTLQPQETAIRTLRLEKALDSKRASELEAKAAEAAQKVEGIHAEASKVLANLQTKVMDKGVSEARGTFNTLARAHSTQAFGWFCAFTVAACFTAWAALHAALISWTPQDTHEAIVGVFQRLLLISLPALFMRVALAKFNLERNLGIVYAHRDAVLRQYRDFESAIGDDAPAKNQFRLEIAKYIFSDPVTGYVTPDGGSEVNINPVIGMLDKVVSKA
jgi:hypothetical protein